MKLRCARPTELWVRCRWASETSAVACFSWNFGILRPPFSCGDRGFSLCRRVISNAPIMTPAAA